MVAKKESFFAFAVIRHIGWKMWKIAKIKISRKSNQSPKCGHDQNETWTTSHQKHSPLPLRYLGLIWKLKQFAENLFPADFRPISPKYGFFQFFSKIRKKSKNCLCETIRNAISHISYMNHFSCGCDAGNIKAQCWF